jgi:hypothetical protein
MTRHVFVKRAVMAVALIAVATCKDATDNSAIAGWLDVRLVSPNVDDGGLSIRIGGARIDSVRTAFPILAQLAPTDTNRVFVVGGNVGTGTVAQIYVPDTRHASLYTGTVQEVVVRTTYAQRAATGYAVVVATP